MRHAVSFFAFTASLGFIAASAYSNWLFAQTIATAEHELYLFRALGILTVAINASGLFLVSFNRRAGRPFSAASTLALFMLGLSFSFCASFGLAAYSRQGRADQMETAQAIRSNLQRQLEYVYSLKPTKENLAKIDELTKKLETKGEMKTVDPQSTFISRITGQDTTTIRTILALLYATLIEAGAALLPYTSLAHLGDTYGAKTGDTIGTDTRPRSSIPIIREPFRAEEDPGRGDTVPAIPGTGEPERESPARHEHAGDNGKRPIRFISKAATTERKEDGTTAPQVQGTERRAMERKRFGPGVDTRKRKGQE